MNKPEEIFSYAIEEVRDRLVAARSKLQELTRKGYRENLDPVIGLLTCGIITLYHEREEIMESEIKQLEAKRGKGLSFRPRGIGTDTTPGCFVCGGAPGAYSNISAFVASKEEGDEIVSWFKTGAWLDFRPSEPTWLQVKIGACDNHLPNLELLNSLTHYYSRISRQDVADAMALATTP